MKSPSTIAIPPLGCALKQDSILGKIFWNVIGFATPLAIAAVVVPRLLALIGAERFGLLALAWGMVGYASVIDLGIGRATTQQVSGLRGGAQNHLIPDVVATAIRLTSLTGALGMLLIFMAALGGLYRLVHVQTVPAQEIAFSIMLLALALPMQAVSATYRGVNEAYLNFKGINILRICLGAANFGAPYLVALYTKDVHWLVATLVVSRGIALLFFRHFALACLKREGHPIRGVYVRGFARRLLQFGGWFSLSSLISPLLVQADRFLIGALLSASAVTIYVLPYELTAQTLVLSGAVTSVAFPLISNLILTAPASAERMFRQWQRRLAALMLAAMAILAWIMPELLHLWLGPQVAPESVQVGRILCAGVFFNSIGAMYFSLLHAHGKTRLTAILHVLELPGFLVALYLLIRGYGVTGAAFAWTLRVAVDAIALALAARRLTDRRNA
jgi:O-antigen/teichoic acid export membrane protein